MCSVEQRFEHVPRRRRRSGASARDDEVRRRRRRRDHARHRSRRRPFRHRVAKVPCRSSPDSSPARARALGATTRAANARSPRASASARRSFGAPPFFVASRTSRRDRSFARRAGACSAGGFHVLEDGTESAMKFTCWACCPRHRLRLVDATVDAAVVFVASVRKRGRTSASRASAASGVVHPRASRRRLALTTDPSDAVSDGSRAPVCGTALVLALVRDVARWPRERCVAPASACSCARAHRRDDS